VVPSGMRSVKERPLVALDENIFSPPSSPPVGISPTGQMRGDLLGGPMVLQTDREWMSYFVTLVC